MQDKSCSSHQSRQQYLQNLFESLISDFFVFVNNLFGICYFVNSDVNKMQVLCSQKTHCYIEGLMGSKQSV